MTQKELEKITNQILFRFQRANETYIDLMTKHILDNGRLTASDINRIEQYRLMGANIDEIEGILADATNKSIKDIEKMYVSKMDDVYKGQSKYYKAKGIKQVPLVKNRRAVTLARTVAKRTGQTLKNISRTTSVYSQYKAMVDESILLVSQGVDNYERVIRTKLNQAQQKGLFVKTRRTRQGRYRGLTQRYDSGLERRLDSAIRLNLTEGIKQVEQGMLDITGNEFGADGYEIDAHALCGADHIDIQGRQFTQEEFRIEVEEPSENGDIRPIGELNCTHTVYPILLGISEPTYSSEELDEMNALSEEKVKLYDDKPMDKQPSRYECSQKMRALETNIRTEKEILNGVLKANDTEAIAKSRKKIKNYKQKYDIISKTAKIDKRPELMRVYGKG